MMGGFNRILNEVSLLGRAMSREFKQLGEKIFKTMSEEDKARKEEHKEVLALLKENKKDMKEIRKSLEAFYKESFRDG